MTNKEMADAVFVAVKGYMDQHLGAVAKRLEDMDAAIKAIPAGPKGDAGDKGDPGITVEVDYNQVLKMITDLIPAPIPGEKGANGVNGKDGIDGLNGIKGTDGIDGVAGTNGRDGVDGRDAFELDILPAIDEERAYERGTYAKHRGGLWKCVTSKPGLDNWECVINGIADVQVDQADDLRSFGVAVELSAGAPIVKTFSLPVVLDRGVFKTDGQYVRGDGVTHGGAFWIAQRDTNEQPGFPGSDAWRLSVKRGRDGKDAVPEFAPVNGSGATAMKMLALQDVPNSCSQIVKGQEFIEQDPDRAEQWIRGGIAEPVGVKRRLVPDWRGLTICILASGPSMTQEQADYVRGRCKTIVINTTFRLAPWADMLYACDARWWKCAEKGKTYHEEASEIFSGELWTQDVQAQDLAGMHRVHSVRLPGLGKTEGTIHQGANSGYQPINLAYQAGAARIVLLGYDMKEADRKSHWHGDHPNPINAKNPYKLWLENFNQLAADLKAEGVQVVNCTPGTALKAFPKMDLANAL